MLDCRLDGNNRSPPLGLPFLDGVLSKLAPLKEDVKRHEHFHVAKGDKHSPVSDGVGGDVLDKDWQRHSASPVTQTRRGNETVSNETRKSLTELTAAHNICWVAA